MRVCVGCGNHNDDDNLFCTGCGQRLWPNSVKRVTPNTSSSAAEVKEAKAAINASTTSSSSSSSSSPSLAMGTGLPTLDAFTRQMNALFFVVIERHQSLLQAFQQTIIT
jgi:rRNA maturation endonuclease Nob1